MGQSRDLVETPLRAWNGQGRRFSIRRRVGLGDVDRTGRARLDAIARLIQDIADADVTAAGLSHDHVWVVRRTDIAVTGWPQFRQELKLTTWAAGLSSRWALRRYSLTGLDGVSVEAASLWIHLDPSSLRPTRLPAAFVDVYGPSSGEERPDSRLRHDQPPDGASGVGWPLRFTDGDVMGHVNNAVVWAALEESWSAPDPVPAVRASVEHRRPIDLDTEAEMVTVERPDGLDHWLVDGAGVLTSAELRYSTIT